MTNSTSFQARAFCLLGSAFHFATLLCFTQMCVAIVTSVPVAAQSGSRVVPHTSVRETLLPNGWKLSPAGKQIPVGDLPLNIETSPNGRYLLVLNNGYGRQSVDIVDTLTDKVTQSLTMSKSWLGLAFAPDGKSFYVSGADDNEVYVFKFAAGHAQSAGKIALGTPVYHALNDKQRQEARKAGTGETAFVAGIAVARDGKRLFAVENVTNRLAVVDIATRKVVAKIEVGQSPYDCVASRDGKRVYVSNWGERTVSAIDAITLQVINTISVGDHPNDLELSDNGHWLFVANANSNTVSVIDAKLGREIEAVNSSLHAKSPIGSTPNGLELSPDGRTLFVANADNNDIAVVDVARPGASTVLGFIPTGWYPTAVRVSRNGRRLFVANGKGVASAPNRAGPNPYARRDDDTQYIGSLLRGTVADIQVPARAKLMEWSKRVYANSPYTDEMKQAARSGRADTAIPARVGAASPIKHVIYVIKENRTYDQVLGDMKEGNGDPSLCIFGADVTPNQHALARQFVLLDNFYVDAEVSADGHNWSMAAYATDYVEKLWPSNYSQRGRKYDFEDGGIAKPTDGYIWDYCRRAGISYRSYGEYVFARAGKPGGGGDKNGDDGGEARKANYTFESALLDHFSVDYPAWDLNITDNFRVDVWLKEFGEYERNGDLPQFQIVRLGGDHTQGTKAGALTPRAYVADNDLALGRLVEAVSTSSYWKDTAIFVLEDDAQNGPDHVDAHRSIAFIASAYTRRNYVDSTMYTTSGVLRTMELILGLPPMSQYDAAALPLYNAFNATADMSAYTALPARVSLTERNAADAPGARQAAQMDFSREDAAPDLLFNELIWMSVRGAQAHMPGPVRSAFVRSIEADRDADEARERNPARAEIRPQVAPRRRAKSRAMQR